MSARLLEALISDSYAAEAVFFSSCSALRRLLSRTSEVASIRLALRQGGITEETIRGFVNRLMRDFRVGERFPHEIALGALAVGLEAWPTDFAEEFLHDLARLRLAEMSTCIRIARECLKRRRLLAANKHKNFDLSPAEVAMPISSGNLLSTSTTSPCTLEVV